MIVERVKAGLVHARSKGIVLGRREKDPDVKHRMATLRSNGLSLRQIASQIGYSPSGVLRVLRKMEGGSDENRE